MTGIQKVVSSPRGGECTLKTNFDETVKEIVQNITGLSGNALDCVTGAAMATVFLGKVPVKTDLAAYLGTGKKTLCQVLRVVAEYGYSSDHPQFREWLGPYAPVDRIKPTAMIYAISAELVMQGLIFDREETPERQQAREFLSLLFAPQAIQSAAQFTGMSIMLEFLESKLMGTVGETIENFVSIRFSTERKPLDKVQAFCDLICEYNPHIAEKAHGEDYSNVIRRLDLDLRAAKRVTVKKRSAVTAVARTKNLIVLDKSGTNG